MKFVLQLPSSELMRTMAHFGAMLQLPILLVSPQSCHCRHKPVTVQLVCEGRGVPTQAFCVLPVSV